MDLSRSDDIVTANYNETIWIFYVVYFSIFMLMLDLLVWKLLFYAEWTYDFLTWACIGCGDGMQQ